MNENTAEKLVCLLSFSDKESGRKGYEVLILNSFGFEISDHYDLVDCLSKVAKSLAELRNFKTYYVLHFFYCSADEVRAEANRILETVKKNSVIFDVCEGCYSTEDFSSCID